MKKALIISALCSALHGCGTTLDAGAPALQPVSLRPVPEMEQFDEHQWPAASEKECREDVRHARSFWQQVAPALAAQVTPDTARSLSPWAQREMKGYRLDLTRRPYHHYLAAAVHALRGGGVGGPQKTSG